MKFSKIAAAALLAAASVPSMAAIGYGDNNAELFLVVSDTTASFTFDTGLTFADLLAAGAGYSKTFSLVGNTDWAFYKTKDTNLADGNATDGTGTRWLTQAVAANAGARVKDKVILLSTKAPQTDVSPAGNNNKLGLFTQNLTKLSDNILFYDNQLSTHLSTANGSSASEKGASGYYGVQDDGDDMNMKTNNAFLGNVVGTSSNLWKFSGNGTLTSSTMKQASSDIVVTFAGDTLTVQIAAVPEPETYALMLAGLMGVAFVARRRRAA